MLNGINRTRRGISILEMVVVLAILGILIGLVLTSIQNARIAAVHSQNKNNLRQIIVATHQLAGERGERISDLMRSSMKGIPSALADQSLLARLIPYVHGKLEYKPDMTLSELEEYSEPDVKVYRNPIDPSWGYDPALANLRGRCSYAINMMAFDGSISLSATLLDGSSQTIAFADNYYARCGADSRVSQVYNSYSQLFDPVMKDLVFGSRRATFADRGWFDVMPVTDPATRTTRPSVPGKTFQVRPRPEDVDPGILQTTFAAGLTVAMFDGSVRTLRPSIDESVYWSLITPAGGEVVSID